MAIMAYFFSGTDSYDFSRKAYTSCCFTFFYAEIVIVIFFMLAITIQDMALSWSNKELATRKNAVWFELTNQRKVTST